MADTSKLTKLGKRIMQYMLYQSSVQLVEGYTAETTEDIAQAIGVDIHTTAGALAQLYKAGLLIRQDNSACYAMDSRKRIPDFVNVTEEGAKLYDVLPRELIEPYEVQKIELPEELIGKNKTETIRNLLIAEYSKSDIAKLVGVRYQYVRTVELKMSASKECTDDRN